EELQGPADEELESLSTTGFVFPAKGVMGSRFDRFIASHWTAGKRAEYHKKRPYLKEIDRAERAKERYDEHMKKRRRTTERRDEDEVEGELLNLDQLIIAQGGFDRPTAIQGALRIARQCIERGPPFSEVDEDSGRLTFRMRRKKVRAMNVNSWTQEEVDSNRRALVDASDYATCNSRSHATSSTCSCTIWANPKGKAKGKAKAKASPANSLKNAIKSGQDTFALYSMATMEARTLINDITAGDQGEWAFAVKFAKNLEGNLKALERGAKTDTTFQRILTEGIPTMKDHTDESELIHALNTFQVNFEQKLHAMQAKVRRIRQMKDLVPSDVDEL
ncbi:unnamed protein product, partial [Prorocentrum cordatum]